MPPPDPPPATPGTRPTCYRCHKPAALCLCARLPTVDNRTQVVILQHRRERFHAVGTARLARLGLRSATLIEALGAIPRPALPARTALLYPKDGAADLASLPADARPDALLVLDGTWHQAHRLFSDNPWLDQLPAVRLAPAAPSRYRIRRQARAEHLSTIECLVAALRLLEPDTAGLGDLLQAFDSMVDDQLRFMLDPAAEPRHQRRRPRASRAVPTTWLDAPQRHVIIYGETAPLEPTRKGRGQQLVSWSALRPATGEVFEGLVRPERLPAAAHLAHMGLCPADLVAAPDVDQLGRAWGAWRRDDDLLAAWDPGRLGLLRRIEGPAATPLLLKALWCNVTHEKCGSLDELVERQALTVHPAAVRGRAGLRLGQAAAVARRLVELAPRTARQGPAPGRRPRR